MELLVSCALAVTDNCHDLSKCPLFPGSPALKNHELLGGFDKTEAANTKIEDKDREGRGGVHRLLLEVRGS